MGKKGKGKGKAEASSSTSSKKAPADCIVPDLLYLGPVTATSNAAFLESAGITHILSIGRSAQNTHTSGSRTIEYIKLPLQDTPESDIRQTVTTACKVIGKAKKEGGKVLVHCQAGISRSPAICAAYLMKNEGLSLREALETLVEKRETASPNEGFLKQLGDIEEETTGQRTFEVEEGKGNMKLVNVLKSLKEKEKEKQG